MENFSYWERKTFLSSWDVIIVGSGITGLSASIRLKEKDPNLKILILERGHLPQGASTKNAGFACFGSLSELLEDEKNTSIEDVLILAERRIKGLFYLRKKLGDKSLCYEHYGSYEMFRDSDRELYENCKDNLLLYNQKFRGITGPSTFSLADDQLKNFGFKGVSHLIKNNYEGQLDTGYLMMALITMAQHLGIHIYDGMGVQSFEESLSEIEIRCDFGYHFKTKKLIIATNGFAQELINEDVAPARAQVLITKPIPNLTLRGCFHYDRGYYYFRNIDGRILLGGGRNLDFAGESTTVMQTTEKIQNALDSILREVILPDQPVEVDYRWSGIMGVGAEKKPIVKRLSEGVFCSVRLGGMGVAIGSLIGCEVADLLLAD